MIDHGQWVIFTNNTFGSGAKWVWSTGETGSSIYVTKPGMYFAKVTIDGCSNTDTVFVANDCYVSVPNVFTPNHDGNNDLFQVFGNLTGVEFLQIQIFNRIGEKVFESYDHEFKWDGTYQGVAQAPQVFSWQLKLTWLDGHRDELRKGTLTLLK